MVSGDRGAAPLSAWLAGRRGGRHQLARTASLRGAGIPRVADPRLRAAHPRSPGGGESDYRATPDKTEILRISGGTPATAGPRSRRKRAGRGPLLARQPFGCGRGAGARVRAGWGWCVKAARDTRSSVVTSSMVSSGHPGYRIRPLGRPEPPPALTFCNKPYSTPDCAIEHVRRSRSRDELLRSLNRGRRS
jgi:hypothetical protein